MPTNAIILSLAVLGDAATLTYRTPEAASVHVERRPVEGTDWVRATGTPQAAAAGSTNLVVLTNVAGGSGLFRLQLRPCDGSVTGTFTYAGPCSRSVRVWCAGNLGVFAMTSGETFDVAAAFALANGQKPCGQTWTAQDLSDGKVLASRTFPSCACGGDASASGRPESCP